MKEQKLISSEVLLFITLLLLTIINIVFIVINITVWDSNKNVTIITTVTIFFQVMLSLAYMLIAILNNKKKNPMKSIN